MPITSLVGFMLALVRTTAWMAMCPPFNTKTIPRLVKLGIASGISLVLAPMVPADQVSLETLPFMTAILTQVFVGLAMGYLTNLLFSAVQAAGSLIDLFGGFTLSQAFDPLLNSQSSVFGRFYNLLATVMLFVTSGHLMLVKGFMRSFEAVPLGGIQLDRMSGAILEHLSTFLIATIEIAGPLLAAFFLTEIALGLLSRAAPQLNIILFGFPLKIFLTILLVIAAVPMLPDAVSSLVEEALRGNMGVLPVGGDGGGG